MQLSTSISCDREHVLHWCDRKLIMFLILDCFSHLMSKNTKYLLITSEHLQVSQLSSSQMNTLNTLFPNRKVLHYAAARVFRLWWQCAERHRNYKAAARCSHKNPFSPCKFWLDSYRFSRMSIDRKIENKKQSNQIFSQNKSENLLLQSTLFQSKAFMFVFILYAFQLVWQDLAPVTWVLCVWLSDIAAALICV